MQRDNHQSIDDGTFNIKWRSSPGSFGQRTSVRGKFGSTVGLGQSSRQCVDLRTQAVGDPCELRSGDDSVGIFIGGSDNLASSVSIVDRIWVVTVGSEP